MLPIAIGTNEAIIIIGIIVLLFGVKKLPELGRSLAEGIHEFRKASRKAQEELEPDDAKQTKTES
jgi:sec-independent protein translocase protein TatA